MGNFSELETVDRRLLKSSVLVHCNLAKKRKIDHENETMQQID